LKQLPKHHFKQLLNYTRRSYYYSDDLIETKAMGPATLPIPRLKKKKLIFDNASSKGLVAIG
jgi:hypothetical protein